MGNIEEIGDILSTEIPPNGYINNPKFRVNKVTDVSELLNEPKKHDPDDFYDNYYNKEFILEGTRHNPKIAKSELLDTEIKIKRKKWKVEKNEYTVCNNILDNGEICGNPVTASDSHRGESVCEKCGIVSSTKTFVVPEQFSVGEYTEHYKTELSESGEHVTALLKSSKYNNIVKYPPKVSKKGTVYYESTKENRKAEYIVTLDILSSQLQMKEFQKEEVQDIIDTYPLNKIHSRVNYKTIIAGICMYVLRLLNPKRGDLKYSNKIFSSYGLSKDNYDIIKKNLDRLLSDRFM